MIKRKIPFLWTFLFLIFLFFFPSLTLFVQEKSIIHDFQVLDCPNDAGQTLCLTWPKEPWEKIGGGGTYVLYFVDPTTHQNYELAPISEGESLKSDAPKYFGFSEENKAYHFIPVNTLPKSLPQNPGQVLKNNVPYSFQLTFQRQGKILAESPVATGSSHPNWFNFAKLNIFIFSLLFSGIILVFISRARRHPNIFIRKIPGLEAVEEAIGRATEMGKPVLYLTGLNPINSLPTIAALSILGRLARKIAQYESKLLVPCFDPIVMAVAKEEVKAAYIDIGRPDAYREEDIYFLTDAQFAYVAGVDALMIREKPAANVFMGSYMAESLLLAETGSTTGAIQIAGTDSITQLPFFVATCDYTLLGEELYAASAYISREPLQVGSLKGQDIAKLFLFLLIFVGVIFGLLHTNILYNLCQTFT